MLYAFGGHSDILQVVIFLMISMTIFWNQHNCSKIPHRKTQKEPTFRNVMVIGQCMVIILGNVIAMSFPSSGKYKLYRNPISVSTFRFLFITFGSLYEWLSRIILLQEVARFFETKHPGHYKIYNLCSKYCYKNSFPCIFWIRMKRRKNA